MSTNVALGRPTNHTFTYGPYDSSKAVDGNRDGILANGGCAHTGIAQPAFWQVDLLAVYEIGEVVINFLAEKKSE